MSLVRAHRREARGTALVLVAGIFWWAVAVKGGGQARVAARLRNGGCCTTRATRGSIATSRRRAMSPRWWGPGQVRRDLSSRCGFPFRRCSWWDNRPMLRADGSRFAGRAGLREMKPHIREGSLYDRSGRRHEPRGRADDLDPEQRMTWQFWVAQFAFGWTLPARAPGRGKMEIGGRGKNPHAYRESGVGSRDYLRAE